MDSNACKLTRAQARACEHECSRIRADDTVWLSLNVSEIESKGPEHADVLRSLDMLEVQAGIPIRTECADTGERQPGRSVECNVPAIQLQGIARVHSDADRDLIEPCVRHGDRANRAGNSQVIRA